MGYHRAGFDVFGVDTSAARLERYPFPCFRDDALEFVLEAGDTFDFIHASPPCQAYSRATVAMDGREARYDRLIANTREVLRATGVPYVIENVRDARPELENTFLLCGRMFGLEAVDDDGTRLVLDRHRVFESNLLLSPPVVHYPHRRGVQVAGVYGGARRDKDEARNIRGGGYVPSSLRVLRDLLDTPWMSRQGCYLAIPPAYSEHIGAQVLWQIEATA
jgi:DNA (cytosine-5)-methyltransferase 1